MIKFLFFCLIALTTLPLLSQTVSYPEASFNNPRETMNYFLKTMKGYKTGDSQALDLAIQALNMSALDETTRLDSARLAAQRLINTLDRIEFIKIDSIPLTPNSDLWVYKKKTVVVDGQEHQVQIAIGKTKDEQWLFTPETLSNIYFYEKSLKNKNVAVGVVELQDWKSKLKKAMPDWMGERSFIMLNGQWVGLFLTIFFAFLIERILQFYIGRATQKYLFDRHVNLTEKTKKRLTFPVGIMVFCGVISFCVRPLEFPDSLLSIFIRLCIVGFSVGSVLAAYHLVDIICLFLEEKARASENKFDDILVPLIRKTTKFFVLAVGVIVIGNSLTLDMKGILAGMGIGGIAFALAAKDTISNLFGSVTVLVDRPFSIGDWVVIDGNIEGTIEQVGLRSTRIRTFYDSQITLPNGRLTNAHIDNYGKRTYRRFSTKLGIQYDTPPEKVEAFCEGIRQIIIHHKFTRKDNFHVYFNGFNNSSLDILLYVFWEVPDWATELQEKHRLLIDILRLGNKMEIDFAFPTQTIHMFNEEKAAREELPPEYDAFMLGMREGKSLAEKTISSPQHRSHIQAFE